MSTHNIIKDGSVKQKQAFKCERYIVDPVTGKAVKNPEWTSEQEAKLVTITKPKIPFRLKAPLEKIRKCQLKKEIPVICRKQLTPQQILEKLAQYAKAGQNAKINCMGYLTNLVVIHKFKKLYPTQGHIGKVINITRGWANQTLAALEEDKLLESLFRFLCSKCYAVQATVLDPEFKDQFAKYFPWIKYHENKAAVAEFTYNINLRYIYSNLVSNVIVDNVTNSQKREILSEISSQQEKSQTFLTSILSGLCAKLKA